MALAPELMVTIHPRDAKIVGVADGDEVRVESRRGELFGRALVTDSVMEGSIFVPFVKLKESAANFLTNQAFDPDSQIPEYKVCAVRVARKDAPRRKRKGSRGVAGAFRP